MNGKEWIKSVKRRLEEESFKGMDLPFYDGKKIPYSFKIISYKENKPESINILKYQTDLFICQIYQKKDGYPELLLKGR